MEADSLKKQFPEITSRFFSAGETILYQGELPRTAYVVKSGLIKMYSISANGEERIVDFNVGGEILASSWVFDNASSTLYYYQAIEDCDLYEI
ncbi:MAG: cyclic nucleotide-binding domain-containing protein, partial [Candidatus Saccharibacteria bacterium]